MKPVAPNMAFVQHKNGFAVYVLENESLSLSLVPELGAKLISLVNRDTGREWMWHPVGGRQLFRNQLGDDFATSTLVGWDECLPTVAPCISQGRQLPDHGEIWSVPWLLDGEAWSQGKLTTSVLLAVSPLRFARTIELFGNVIRVSYQLTNCHDQPEEFLWAMHPLLSLTHGDALDLSAETHRHLVGETWMANLDFDSAQPSCAKVFAGPLHEGRASISNARTGERITFVWDTQLNDTLGIWLTRGGWNGHHHLALEPTNARQDALSAASAGRCCGIVAAYATLSWQVTITIDSKSRSSTHS